MSRQATIDGALVNRLAQRVVPHIEQHDRLVRHACKHQCLLAGSIGAGMTKLPIVLRQDAARLAGRVDSQAQRQWWPTWAASNGPAAASLEASAAFGSGLRVLRVENELLKILDLRCDTSAVHSKVTLSVTRSVTPFYWCNGLHLRKQGVTPSFWRKRGGRKQGVTPSFWWFGRECNDECNAKQRY